MSTLLCSGTVVELENEPAHDTAGITALGTSARQANSRFAIGYDGKSSWSDGHPINAEFTNAVTVNVIRLGHIYSQEEFTAG